MLGAICGDIIGSVHERAATKRTDFRLFDRAMRFTDDTVLTVATAHAILHGIPFADAYHEYGRRFPHCGFGSAFKRWLRSDDRQPYFSYGNGSAMRVSPVGFAARSLDEALGEARRSALPTHDHPEGIKGAEALAAAIFLARRGADKKAIRAAIESRFGYDLHRRVDAIRPGYRFDVTCQGSVPEAIIAFLDSDDVESAIRLAISLGGDADTLACMAGAVAQAFYKVVPAAIVAEVERRLTPELWALTQEFCERYAVRYRE